ncbi:metallophosphoesterase [Sungkyunkwania multivorans]|uniref:Metallophosphoesterase n=1 Tax=Sungkyunkwania multivorans TaxID=1173618 RepID=A0ABW3D3A2_9FLAO
MKTDQPQLLLLILFVLMSSCATYKSQMLPETNTVPAQNKKVIHTFYLIGDAGGAKKGKSTAALLAFKEIVSEAPKESTAIFLGDNIYEEGLPRESDPKYALAAHRLQVQLETVKNFKGNTVFIPGNHDWYNEGLKSVKRQEKMVEDTLGKDTFLPEDGCAITEVDISEDVHLVLIDSQWYLTDWDRHPTINDDCDIKTRGHFFAEFKDILKDNQNKTVVVAMHHPISTHGSHGGEFPLKKHLFPFQAKVPLPILGSLITELRSSGGVSPQDRNNVRYARLANRLMTLAQERDRVIFVSGHEHNLQFNSDDGVPIIVSGAGAKETAARLVGDAQFTYGRQGYAILRMFSDGSSEVSFYDTNNERLYTTEVHEKLAVFEGTFDQDFPKEKKASIYPKADTEKSKGYQKFFGEHFRASYGIEVAAPVALLDTLYGGLTPIRMGGGNQSKTLRLVDKEGREYNMRALKKSAVSFLQASVFQQEYIKDQFENSFPERMLQDFYTAAYPYGPFAVGTLSDAVGVYHTEPKLFYVPKQQALGKYNTNYGDELYMIEAKASDSNNDHDNFGSPDEIDSTSKFFENLRKDEKYVLDTDAYIRARLFDMLIGDWDRHEDQWRWAAFEEGGKVIYKPIPRDRDQAFSKFDGKLLDIIRFLSPSTRILSEYSREYEDLEWFNFEPIRLDRTLLSGTDEKAWIEQAKFIEQNLSDDIIDRAFANIPIEVRSMDVEEVKKKLKSRRAKISEAATSYFKLLNELMIVTGTDKDDHFVIERRPDGITNVKAYRIKDGVKADLFFERAFNSDITKEVWIYGLDDDDIFEVSGKGNKPVLIRLIGGQNNDIYRIENGKKLRVYDHKSKPNTVERNKGAKIKFTDDYEINLFEEASNIYNANTWIPALGFNPDTGISVGLGFSHTHYGFERSPFTSKHTVAANVYFATSGFVVNYDGEFGNIFGNTNLIVGARATSDNFTQNFFGFGSDTPNFDDDLDLDFNRVRLSELGAYVGVAARGKYGSDLLAKIRFDAITIEETGTRFIDAIGAGIEEFYDTKYFSTADIVYTYESHDQRISPTRGMEFGLGGGYTLNLRETNRSFFYLRPSITFYNRITRDGNLVLKTAASSHLNFTSIEDLEFYQAANLGGNNGLRGYRNERFSGEKSLVFNGDLRYSLKSFKTSFIPLQIGLYGGYDLGRVWVDNDPDSEWQDSFGGGLWIDSVNALGANIGLFSSDDGLRISFGFGFNF